MPVVRPTVHLNDVHRSTPYEFNETAETGQLLTVVGSPVIASEPWTAKESSVLQLPPVPEWMGVSPQPVEPTTED